MCAKVRTLLVRARNALSPFEAEVEVTKFRPNGVSGEKGSVKY